MYSDYEIPDEVLEASLNQDTEDSRRLLTPSNITKSRSANQISDLTQDSPDLAIRKRANSHNVPKLKYSQSLKHSSCIYDYKPPSQRPISRGLLLSRSFSRQQGKSISDILGTPPAVPTSRRPSILCNCCNSVHVGQTLPGMSLTPGIPRSTTASPTYENYTPRSITATSQRSSIQVRSDSDSESDYEDLDQLTSDFTQVTISPSTLMTSEMTSETLVTSPDVSEPLTLRTVQSPGEVVVTLEVEP